ncbi:restriction endonuclease subunit S [Arthrobacter sp. 31Y]|uniref:restriction endonuclease subunit S n=1 Tax=Arthrobacter sp. 31Y TaxID=1115632 RepID=UPI0004637D68|nr:restriction endonuclease subunit S [Arthrobacter sp. 31Y]
MTSALTIKGKTSQTWSRASLGEHVDILSGFAFDSKLFSGSGGMPLIRIRDVVRGRTETRYTGKYDSRFVVYPGDLLVGMDGDFNRALWSSEPALLNQRVCKVISNPETLDPRYLYHFLPGALLEIWHQTPFATVKHLSAKGIRAISIPLPRVEEQRRIAAILDKADEMRAKRRQAIAHLDTLTQSIFYSMFGDPVQNPYGLDRVSLTEVGRLYSGGTPSKEVTDNWIGSTPWFSPKDLKKARLFDSIDHISPQVPANTSLRLLPIGTVVFVVRGMILAHSFPVALLECEATINQDLKAILPTKEVVPEFLLACLQAQQEYVVGLVETAAHGTKKVTTETLNKAWVFDVKLDVQQTFASRVAAVERLKETHRKHLAELDALFASLQSRAFKGEL